MKFKFRAELPTDAERIKKALGESILSWKEFDVYIATKPVPYKVPDIEVEFETVENGLTLDEIRLVMENIPDCHIASQTINYLDVYTGVRNYQDKPKFTFPVIIDRLEKEAKKFN